MGKALYRKHRSTTFSEVVGQEHITRTLANAIAASKISHAYLFTGPRGVGKTSVARILAHEVNQLEYSETNTHLDIIEIDAASNRRIDEIRDLRDKVHIPPTSSKYKVYIIDEVHMLTKEAFNALLKTLEEPPAHCIFILATTEAHKVPDTIISRTQRFDFHRISNRELVDHLKNIAKQEKIRISSEALELIARHGKGSFRDSIGMLDQLSSETTEVGEQEVREVLGMPSMDDVTTILGAVESSDIILLGATLTRLEDSQTDIAGLTKAIADEIRGKIVAGDSSSQSLGLLKSLLEVEKSPQPWSKLLVVLVEAMSEVKSPILAQIPRDNNPNQKKSEVPTDQEQVKPSAMNSEPRPANSDSSVSNSELMEWWPKVVSKVKDQAASIYTALRLGSPTLEGNQLQVNFQFPLHQKKLDSAKSKDILSSIITDITGNVYFISTAVDTSLKTATQEPTKKKPDHSDPSLTSISNIFGSAEVLES